MKIGVRDKCVVGGNTLEDKMSILKEIGYDFVELVIRPDQVPESSAELGTVGKQAAENTGLPILHTSLGGFANFAQKDAAERATMVKKVEAVTDISSEVGADTVLLASREDPARNCDEYADTYRRELQGVADKAASLGITFCLEHVGDYKPYLLAELVRAIEHPAVRVYFDMGNCLHVGESPLEQARICAPVIGQLHIKGGPIAPLAAMPLLEIREILEEAGFAGRGCLEISNQGNDKHLIEAYGLLKMAGYV